MGRRNPGRDIYPDLRVVGQELPADFADRIARMRATGDPRLPAVLRLAYEEGWTCTALAVALDLTKARVAQIVRAAPQTDVPGIDIPPPPRRAATPTAERPSLTDTEIAELRKLQQVARLVNGSVKSHDPRRRASERLTALLHDYHTSRGISVYHLAQLIEVTTGAVRSRLARHGYKSPLPSHADQRYQGRGTGEQPNPGQQQADVKTRPTLTPKEANELRKLQQVACTINGATKSDDPRRRSAERLVDLLNYYRTQRGVSVYRLARLTGVTRGAIQSRLSRYGHRKPSPSQADDRYVGLSTGERRTRRARRARQLTADDVRACRRAVADGVPISHLTRRYWVGNGTISAAVYGKTWATLTDPPPLPRRVMPTRARRVSKLTPETVAEARRRYLAGETKRAIAATYGVGEDTVREAIHGIRWQDVTDPPPVPRTTGDAQ